MSSFALIGAAGYIAPRHLKAIKDTGHQLVAAVDRHDTVGILDSYFPDARFFTEFERFDRHVDLLRRRGVPIDYVSIASPNYLHDSHARFALRVGANAICEKPVVINPWNVEGLQAMEAETGGRVFTILQLRHHPSVIALKERITTTLLADSSRQFEVDLHYVTGRGAWYFSSWKGEDNKSGGIAANIGVHFFDMLLWIFGPPVESEVDLLDRDSGGGTIRFANATVRWFLSINVAHLPESARAKGQRTFRSIRVDQDEIEFSDGFTDLHTTSYRHILDGSGFGLKDALPSIELVHNIRVAEPSGRTPSLLAADFQRT
jgi:UDP-N-acetyl-2-amino-2-deoxyglucuronate dehydrogenase